MRRALAVAVCGVLLSLIALPALADHVVQSDGNDTHGPLDIARIEHKHLRGDPVVFIHKIVMQRGWRRRAIHSTAQHDRYIIVTFDADLSKGSHCIGCISEREVLIHASRWHVFATLYNHLGDPPRKLTNLHVWRPSRRTIAFSVGRHQLSHKHIDFYDWGVETFYERSASSCPQKDPCFDMTPNHPNRLLRHNL
jgi:hypothetical protein